LERNNSVYVLVAMSEQPDKKAGRFSEIHIAIVIAIVIGICLACAIIILEVRTERFSAVYINPDTYSNYPENRTISFIYGINSNEIEKTNYTIYIRSGDTLVETKQIELMPKGKFEERKVLQLPENVVYPVKISVQYISPHDKNEVFFRVRNGSIAK
jgi:uncharacterized membrane protein